MKRIIALVTILTAVSTSRAEINISFDSSSGQTGKAMNIQRALDRDVPPPVLLPVLDHRDSPLSQVQSQGILLPINASDEKDNNKFPQRLAVFESAQFNTQKMPQAKGTPQVNCWEDNCRMENVCGNIKSCNRNCQLLGGACGVAGRWITLYYTGGTQPTLAHGIGTFAGIGCNLTCKEWACDDIPDCNPVKKCDTHCETTSGNGDLINVNTGQVIYQ